MIYNALITNEAHQIGITIGHAKQCGYKSCYFDIEFDKNINTLRELGYFVTYAPEHGAHSISWRDTDDRT